MEHYRITADDLIRPMQVMEGVAPYGDIVMTLKQFSRSHETILVSTAWYLTYLAEARGKQELFLQQMPQGLKTLREHAIIESAVSSNRLEGVEVEQSRIKPVVFGKSYLRDRDEEEIRGYRNALQLIHERAKKLPVSEETICDLHRLTRGRIWDSGEYKEKESDIIEKLPNGRIRLRFKTVRASETPKYMKELLRLWPICLEKRWMHPLIALAGFNLDFLCIHPFRDGNGRVSRLLLLLQCYQMGYEVGRYISLERLIEQNKDRYYETLAQSSEGWHLGENDPWPYINYLLYILKSAYIEFEERVGRMKGPRGAKTTLVRDAITRMQDRFTVKDVEQACPGVSREMVRYVLRQIKNKGMVECLGRGPGAQWIKKGNSS